MKWKNVITALNKNGLSQVDIAAHCNCGQSTISDILREKTKQPRFSVGEKLLQLLKEQAK